MAEETNNLQSLLKQEPEEIRAEMAESRFALTNKLEALEEKVKSTVESAQAVVEHTVDTVKESVHDTVETVKRTFDLKYQVNQHPWIMVGSACAAGYVIGSLIPEKKRSAAALAAGASAMAGNGAYPLSLSGMTDGSPPKRHHDVSRHGGRKQAGVTHRLLNQFAEEIGILESAAIGAVMGLARDWLKDAVPPLAPHVEKALDSATTKMGGEPIHGSYAARG